MTGCFRVWHETEKCQIDCGTIWVQIRVGGSVAAAAAEGSFVVRAMQTLLAAEIREFSGSWADSAFVGLTLIYDHRERQMFRRSEDERGKRQVYIIPSFYCSLLKLFHPVFARVSLHYKPLTRTLYKYHLLYSVFLNVPSSLQNQNEKRVAGSQATFSRNF